MRLQAVRTAWTAVRPLAAAPPSLPTLSPFSRCSTGIALGAETWRSCTSAVPDSSHSVVSILLALQDALDHAHDALLWLYALTLLVLCKPHTRRLLPFISTLPVADRAPGRSIVQAAIWYTRVREQGTSPKPYGRDRIRTRLCSGTAEAAVGWRHSIAGARAQITQGGK